MPLKVGIDLDNVVITTTKTLCDYINDAKNSKYYIDTENLEQAVYYVVGTKTGKKSEKYIEIQEEKRGLK